MIISTGISEASYSGYSYQHAWEATSKASCSKGAFEGCSSAFWALEAFQQYV
jgi:hypothetical protein